MHILVLGTGAREHALGWRLAQDPGVARVTCAPGNAGIARTVDVAEVALADPAATAAFVTALRPDLTVVGPEAPLAAGLADQLAGSGCPLFGPTRAAARLETSKAFAKEFMARHQVPTARYRVCRTAGDALDVIERGELGETVVVKADGLAAGKGVVVAEDRAEAASAVRAAMLDGAFGDAGATVVLEERLSGPEVSCFVVADGERFVVLPTAQDHKRVFDEDRGPNTGGMGAFAPSPLVDGTLQARLERDIVRPVLSGMVAEGTPFRGFLYCGLMLTAAGPQVIEFNVRFGDPEAEVALPLVRGNLTAALLAAATGRLDEIDAGAITVEPGCAVGVVLAAAGYPGTVRGGDRIAGLDHLAHEYPDVLAFFAGVKSSGPDLVTAGGRVMTLVARGESYEGAMARVYDAASRVRFDGMHYRRDIGRKALR